MSRKVRNIFRAIMKAAVHDDAVQIEQCLRASGALSPASAGTSDGNVRRQTLPSLLTGRWLRILRFPSFNSWFRLRRVRVVGKRSEPKRCVPPTLTHRSPKGRGSKLTLRLLLLLLL